MTQPGWEIQEFLSTDHERLDELFQQLLAVLESGERDDVAAMWERFDRELLLHLAAEEEYIIPALLRSDERAAHSILAEHRHIRARLTELGTAVDLHTVRLPVARAFVEELRAHARHEDRVLYRWADATLPEADKRSLVSSLVQDLRSRIAAAVI